ncbi:MAG TPA: hypothetical protein DCY88_25805 [Cyanobacteria bacterium UBA11372]|nr:hypothetical protein [Cyanobacteria bacterium UBA11372]
MPLPGGATDKFGNRYEGRWTVFCMIEVMDENADAIRLEPPGTEGEGVEFWLSKENSREYHQVKRQQSDSGRWTLAELENKDRKILSKFWNKLRNSTANCVFISSHAAFQLDELADRARRAASWKEFYQDFLKAGQTKDSEILKNYQQLCRSWHNCPETEAYEALHRVRVETVSEDFLRTTVESRIAALVENDVPANVVDVLAQFALDKVHHELTAYDIWHHLEERNFRRRQWGKDPHILAAVEEANNRYLSPLRDAVITSPPIPRDEAKTVLQKLSSTDSKPGVLLVGEAGVGKSGVMLQVVEALCEQGIPTLAFRIDRLEPTLLPNDVGQQLGLPGSPANVLAAISHKRDCVLIIDQLDAVSLASGRNPQFFDCVAEIIKQVQAHPKMRLVLACRKFDLDNDYRLRHLTDENGIAEPVIINRLPHATVREVFAKLGLDATRLNEKQLNLLSVPLNLRLLAEVAADSRIDALSFKTVRDLYYHFWDYKQAVIERDRLGRPVQWTCVIDALCKYMSHRQVLSAPEDIIDNWRSDTRAMVSEHVLIHDGRRYSFFHEGFFDYAFARRFAANGQNLLQFLRSSEQHLFRRAQVRQILLHEREVDFDSYLENLTELLTSSDIRFHLKQVVFALLAALNDPTPEEWNIIAPLIGAQTDPITQQVWRTLRSSVRWFQFLDSLGLIEEWLRDNSEERIDQTVMLLSIMQRQIPDRVAELVEPYVGVSEAWCNRLVSLIQRANLVAGRRFFDLFLRLIREGVLDQPKEIIDDTRNFWMRIYSLPKEHPEWACEAISCYLNRYLDLSIAAGHSNMFDRKFGSLPHSQFHERMLTESGRNDPKAFVEYIFPFLLRVIELTAIRDGNPPWYDAVWVYRPYGQAYNIKHKLLENMAAALSNLSANYPEKFSLLTEQKIRRSNFETIQYLLIRAYAANGARFADEAVDYLCEQPARFKTGYRGAGQGNIHAAPYWATRQLLEAATPHCSEQKLIKLQSLILDYYTDSEKSADGRLFRGYPQLVLLDAIPPCRLTQAASRRLQEWRRKFTDLDLVEPSGRIEPPKSIEADLVGSPIPEAATQKMTDEQWLRAIKHYDTKEFNLKKDSTFAGGSGQLSHLLEKQVKSEPERFAKLVCKFPDSTHYYYFDAVMRGIGDADIDVQNALLVCQCCHQLPDRPCGRSMSWSIQKLAKLPWPKEILDIAIWYALNDPDPELGTQDSNKTNDIYTEGINSTRGSAVSAIAALIFADKNRTPYFQETLPKIIKDPSIAVRSCAVAALTAVLNYDRDLAVSLFQQLCENEDALLGTQTVEDFLYYALPTHFQQLASIVERMIMSELPEVVEIGARQACLASLMMEEARWLAELCLSGTEDHKQAAAQVFVANLRQARFRDFCEQALIQLFHDSNEKVHSQAARCFLDFEADQLGEYVSLIEAFVDSPSFITHYDNLIGALGKTTAKLPDVTCRVCDRFLDIVATRTRGLYAPEISQLLVRVYSQSKNQQLQKDCLDLIDRMYQMEIDGLAEAITEYER